MSRSARQSSSAANAILDLIQTGAEVHIEDQINRAATVVKESLEKELHEIEERIKSHKEITVTTERETRSVQGYTHRQFPDLLQLYSMGFPLMLVGSAGSGKSTAAEQLAESVNLPFYSMSVGAQTSKTDLVGYMNAGGDYVSTSFRQAYEHGGIYLLDEIDAGNSNVLIILNSALANNQCSFPDQMVKRHKDFFFIATANTYGTGASRQYVGRNQIDAATLDRFITIEWTVDEVLEKQLVDDLDHGTRWWNVVSEVRHFVAEKRFRVVVSPRATYKGASMLQHFDIGTVIEATILAGTSTDQQKEIREKAFQVWESYS